MNKTTKDKLVDQRGQRFGAALTTVVLLAALLTSSIWLIGWQLAVFAVSAFVGLQASPYGFIFRKLIAPRLKGAPHLEPAAPPRFAQLVGFGFAAVAFVGLWLDQILVFQIATGFALAAAFLNAAFGFCLGCQMYLLFARLKA
jgi:hypothetical protein